MSTRAEMDIQPRILLTIDCNSGAQFKDPRSCGKKNESGTSQVILISRLNYVHKEKFLEVRI